MPKIPDHLHTQTLISSGYGVVVGIDEVGRGCWAGPVTAAAVILAPGVQISGARDSKLLTNSKRRELAAKIRHKAVGIGLGWVSSAEVDQFGLSWAVRHSGLRALANLGQNFDAIILDGKHNYLQNDYFSEAHTQADSCCLNVACASIIAKVARDNYMDRLDLQFPNYGFAKHKGYGTAAHRLALKQGVVSAHRQSVAPIKLAVANVN